MTDPKRLPDDPAEFAAYLRERATGHAPGYDIVVYARPHLWIGLADQIERLKDDRRRHVQSLIEKNDEILRLRSVMRDAAEAIERGSTSAPVAEVLRTSVGDAHTEAADRQCDHYGISGYCMRCGDPLPGTDT